MFGCFSFLATPLSFPVDFNPPLSSFGLVFVAAGVADGAVALSLFGLAFRVFDNYEFFILPLCLPPPSSPQRTERLMGGTGQQARIEFKHAIRAPLFLGGNQMDRQNNLSYLTCVFSYFVCVCVT